MKNRTEVDVEKTETDTMIAELQACENILGLLDQNACNVTEWCLPGIFHRMYKELMDKRDRLLKEWNEEASCGQRDRKRMLYRCDNAESPYQLEEDGPCGIYTPNYENPPIPGPAVHVCDICNGVCDMQAPAEGRL